MDWANPIIEFINSDYGILRYMYNLESNQDGVMKPKEGGGTEYKEEERLRVAPYQQEGEEA